MATEPYDDYRTCDKCDKKFLLHDEIAWNIEGMTNPFIGDEDVEGAYCYKCVKVMETNAWLGKKEE